MKPKDIFGLAVRILGLWFLNLALNNLALLFYQVKNWPYVMIDVLAAWWLIAGANLFTRLAYPESDGQHENRAQPDPARRTGE